MSRYRVRAATAHRAVGLVRVPVLVLVLVLVAACSTWRPAPPPSEPIESVVLLPIHDGANRSAYSGIFMHYSWIADTGAAKKVASDLVRHCMP